jgi:hypothetical protein
MLNEVKHLGSMEHPIRQTRCIRLRLSMTPPGNPAVYSASVTSANRRCSSPVGANPCTRELSP